MYVIDACVYVSSIRAQEPHHQASRSFLNEVRARRAVVKSPETLVPEVAGVLGRGTEGSAQGIGYAMALRKLPHHEFFAVDRQLADLAATVGALQGLKGMDALYAALAHQESARLITVDDELVDRAPSGSQVATPADELFRLTGHRIIP
ncbi:MAG: PIN domain-containing protein [Anaerolineae bacterium]|nr:PIN domain-containing protein [Anaerolineae bacterium]